MPQRIFLGYDSPFLPKLVDLLLADRDTLPHTLILVPTSQSGRTLRESLAAQASALLAPTVSTPGALLQTESPSIAPKWLQKIAFIETLETISKTDPHSLPALLPKQPSNSSPDWATSLASEITSLRFQLQDNLLDLSSAAKILKNTPDAERWHDLARIESIAIQKLSSWGYTSRLPFQLPTNFTEIILAGITELPTSIAQALEKTSTPVTSIIPAPESEQQNFSLLGLPLEIWAHRHLPQSAHIALHANPAAQATATLQIISTIGAPSNQFAIGSPDEQTAAALTHTLTQNAWPAFHPAAKQALPPISRWLLAWKTWLINPDSKNLAALLTLPQSNHFISGNTPDLLQELNSIRNSNPTIPPSEILNLPNHKITPNLLTSVSNLLTERETFLNNPFPKALAQHLKPIPQTDSTSHSLSFIQDFLNTSLPIFSQIKRSHPFWLNILLSEIPTPPPQPPQNRTIDIQGWLELLFEPAPHLIICGMNDSFVPAKSGGEPWLSENIRKILGLTSDSHRHARDSFLLQAIVQMRASSGSTHILCGKSGTTGETHTPSRLLLQTSRENLVPTVRTLFREIEPPEANLAWSKDFDWQTPSRQLPDTLSITSLRDYLDCPYRFYLKHILKIQKPEPDRREMNHRDFGNIIHKILQTWAENPEAVSLSNPTKLNAYLHSTLDKLISHHFGKNPPLAIIIQTHSMRQRLEWFSLIQIESQAQGWLPILAEHPISIPSSPFTIKGKIDRIDQNLHTGQLRVIDYKTGNVKNVETEHRSKHPKGAADQNPPSSLHKGAAHQNPPSHPHNWTNLQLPLYALAIQKSPSAPPPIPCYITLGKNKESISIQTWDSFDQTDLTSATDCLHWITNQISNQIFWPPNEKTKYDDFSLLSPNSSLPKTTTPPFP